MPSTYIARRFVLLAITIVQATTQTCYYPDGNTIASSDTPCNNTGGACCGADTLCMDNGLCLLNGVMSRGSCTDPKWGSSCANFCETESPHGGITIYPCSGWGTNFSCYGECDAEHIFEVPGGSAVMLRSAQVGGKGSVVVGGQTVLSVESGNETVATNSSSGSQATAAAQDSGKRCTAADMVGVGIGVGAPLALALAAALFVLFRQRRQQKPDPRRSQEQYRYSPQPQTQQTIFTAYQPGRKAEAHTVTYPELDSFGRGLTELDGTRDMKELPSNYK